MNNNRKCRGTGTLTEFWREGMQDSVRANFPLVFFLISLPFMLSDSSASVACVCVFEVPTKGSWGFASERGAAKESSVVQAWMTSGSWEKA